MVLQRLCEEPNVELHWSMQPGVTDGSLEFSETREAAFEAYRAVESDWLGLQGPPLVLAILCIRADYVKASILAGTMTRHQSKLRTFRNMPLRAQAYTINIDAHVPFSTPLLTDALMSAGIVQAPTSQNCVLYGGFLLAYVPQLNTTAGLHWSTQPGAYGRITLYSTAEGYQSKYDYYRGGSADSAPEVAMVAMHFAEGSLDKLIATGLLAKGKGQGEYSYHASVYAASLFDDRAVAYTAERVLVRTVGLAPELPAEQPADADHLMEVPDIACVEYELTLLRRVDTLQRARSSNYTGLHRIIEEKEREFAEMKATFGAEFVEPTDAEAVVEPTDAEAEDFKRKSGMGNRCSRSSRSFAQRSRSPIPKARPTCARSSTDHLRQELVDKQMMSDVEKRELAAEREERAAEREAIEREQPAEREERERELAAEREAIASKERELTILRQIDAIQAPILNKYTGVPLWIEAAERDLAERKARLALKSSSHQMLRLSSNQ